MKKNHHHFRAHTFFHLKSKTVSRSDEKIKTQFLGEEKKYTPLAFSFFLIFYALTCVHRPNDSPMLTHWCVGGSSSSWFFSSVFSVWWDVPQKILILLRSGRFLFWWGTVFCLRSKSYSVEYETKVSLGRGCSRRRCPRFHPTEKVCHQRPMWRRRLMVRLKKKKKKREKRWRRGRCWKPWFFFSKKSKRKNTNKKHVSLFLWTQHFFEGCYTEELTSEHWSGAAEVEGRGRGGDPTNSVAISALVASLRSLYFSSWANSASMSLCLSLWKASSKYKNRISSWFSVRHVWANWFGWLSKHPSHLSKTISITVLKRSVSNLRKKFSIVSSYLESKNRGQGKKAKSVGWSGGWVTSQKSWISISWNSG